MEIEHSPLWDIVAEVVNSGETTTNYGWRCEITYTDFQDGEKRKDYRVMVVTALTNVRDYFSGYTDSLIITCLMPMGKLVKRIYPSRRELEITLYKEPYREGDLEEDENEPVTRERFMATLMSQGPENMEIQGREDQDENTLDLMDVREVQFQLRNHLIDQLRLIQVGGVFRKVKMTELIQALLTKESKKAKVDGERKLLGVDMVEANNEQIREQVMFTHGTKLVDVPGFLQKEVGVYNSSLGHFIQNRHWFVYPLHDCKEYERREYTGTLVIVPKHKLANIERTFLKKGDSLTVLVTSETGFQDDDGIQYLNEGNGSRYTDASQMVELMGKSQGNKLTVDRKKVNSEYVSEEYEQRPYQELLYNAKVAQQRLTANPFTITSSLNARRGHYFKCIWENHDSSMLVPGMPFRVLSLNKDEVVEHRGILHRVDNLTLKAGHMGVKKFHHQCVMYLFLRKYPFK